MQHELPDTHAGRKLSEGDAEQKARHDAAPATTAGARQQGCDWARSGSSSTFVSSCVIEETQLSSSAKYCICAPCASKESLHSLKCDEAWSAGIEYAPLPR